MRDAALLASGKCAASFPEQCRGALPELYRLWTVHLDDNIPSVRADAAAALGDTMQAYPELLEQLLPLIRQASLCAGLSMPVPVCLCLCVCICVGSLRSSL